MFAPSKIENPLPGPSGLARVPVVKRATPEPLREEPFADDLDINYDNLDDLEATTSHQDEILYEGMVTVASPKSKIVPSNTKILATASLKRPNDGQLTTAKRRPMKDVTNTLAPYR